MILITGASSGIGEACARAFAADRNTQGLVLVARRKERLERLARELKRGNGGLEVYVARVDVGSRKGIELFARKNAKLLARVAVLVNNAGLARGLDPLQAGSVDHWDEMIDTNVKGLLYMTRAVLPYFVANNDGHIVNLSSVAGHWVYPKGAVYCATKHAVRALNEGLRMDLVGTKIRITAISPGMVETEFSRIRLGDPKKAKAVYSGMTPLTAEDVAEAVVWSVRRPKHVNIQDIVLFPTDQAAPTLVARSSKKSLGK